MKGGRGGDGRRERRRWKAGEEAMEGGVARPGRRGRGRCHLQKRRRAGAQARYKLPRALPRARERQREGVAQPGADGAKEPRRVAEEAE